MSDEFVHEVRFDPGTQHGQHYAGIVKSSKYLNTENIAKVWQLVQELQRQQRAERVGQ
jgi:hypothetical protein